MNKDFERLTMAIAEATTNAELAGICYVENGIEQMFQAEKITAQQYEILFNLVNKLNGYYKPIKKII